MWVKDETGNVSGSHKARHLMGILLYLQVVERRERPPLAIASCGNAALAAAVLARAADRPLQVFVPTDAEAAGARAAARAGRRRSRPARASRTCRATPACTAFHAALADGALPFCCQGSENGLTIEGGETLGLRDDDAARRDAARPRRHPGGRRRARQRGHPGAGAPRTAPGWSRSCRGSTRCRRAAPGRSSGPGTPSRSCCAPRARLDALERATKHRSEFMWPWEETPHSVAHGILDDETYDWLAIVKGMLASRGTALVVDEDAAAGGERAGARDDGDPGVPHRLGRPGGADAAAARRRGRARASGRRCSSRGCSGRGGHDGRQIPEGSVLPVRHRDVGALQLLRHLGGAGAVPDHRPRACPTRRRR